MIEPEADTAPRIGEAGVAALRATRPWVLFTGIVALIGAAYSLIHTLLVPMLMPTTISPNLPPQLMAFVFTTSIVLGALAVVVNILFGWFALQYGRRIKTCLDALSPQGLEEALRWQRRYWTFQGVMLIVAIVVVIAVFIAVIVLGATAVQQGGYNL